MISTAEQAAPTQPAVDSSWCDTRISVIGASFGTGNLGVSALATGTISAIASSFPGAEILLVDYAREPSARAVRTQDGDITVETMNVRFSKKLFLPNNIALLIFLAILARLIPIRAVSTRILRSNACLWRLHQSKAFLSLAGGDSFSDIYGLGRLVYVALPQFLAIALGRPLILLPQTIGPFKGAAARWIARAIMKRAEVVYSRDHASLELARTGFGIPPAHLRFSYDMAFAMMAKTPQTREYADLLAETEGMIVVGLNVSGLLLMGGYNRSNMFGLATNYAKAMSSLVERVLEDEKVVVILVPHVLGSEPESDVTGCHAFWSELPAALQARVLRIDGSYDHQEIKAIIGRCDFFIGARMHACIAAVSQSVPAACLAYSRKFSGLLDGIGFGELVVDLRAAGPVIIVEQVCNLFNNRQSFRERLLEAMPGVKHSVLRMLATSGLPAFRDDKYGMHKPQCSSSL